MNRSDVSRRRVLQIAAALAAAPAAAAANRAEPEEPRTVATPDPPAPPTPIAVADGDRRANGYLTLARLDAGGVATGRHAGVSVDLFLGADGSWHVALAVPEGVPGTSVAPVAATAGAAGRGAPPALLSALWDVAFAPRTRPLALVEIDYDDRHRDAIRRVLGAGKPEDAVRLAAVAARDYQIVEDNPERLAGWAPYNAVVRSEGRNYLANLEPLARATAAGVEPVALAAD